MVYAFITLFSGKLKKYNETKKSGGALVRPKRTLPRKRDRLNLFLLPLKADAFTKSIPVGCLSKKRQMQGAPLLNNEAYLRTSKQ